MSDFWKILEIAPTTDRSVIKQAYAALAKKYHPEQYPEEFLNLRNAYEAAMEYASSENGAFFVRSKSYHTTISPEKTEKINFEEPQSVELEEVINDKEQEEQEISESIYWDLSKLNEESEADCT